MKKTFAILISCTMILSSSCVLQAKTPMVNPDLKNYINNHSKINRTKSLDINHDGRINIKDLKVLDKALNTTYKNRKYNPAADLNNNNVINMSDRMILMKYLAEHNIPIPTMPPIFIATPAPTSTTAPAVNYDVNQDGSIDAKDIAVIDSLMNTLSGNPDFNPAADLNGDGAINVPDRMLLMGYLSKNNIPVPTIPPISIETSTPAPTSTTAPAVNYDVNQNGSIDAKDIAVIDSLMNTLSGNPNFNPAADLNGDGTINMPDRMLLMGYLSKNNIPVTTIPPIYLSTK